MIDHLIFDFDGTISNSYPLFVSFLHRYAKQNQLPFLLDDETAERALRIKLQYAFERLEWQNHVTYQAFLDAFRDFQKADALSFQPFPEAIALLNNVYSKKKKLYLYTHTGSVVNEMLKNMGIDHLFTFVLDQSYHFPAKPAPDALLFLIQKFGLDPKACMMIGDRPIDANAGMNAGMSGCLWDRDDLYPNSNVTYKVRSLLEIQDIIEK